MHETGVSFLLLGYGTLGLGLLEGLMAAEHCRVIGVFRWTSRPDTATQMDNDDKAFARLVRRNAIPEIRCESVNSPSFLRVLKEKQPDCVLVGSWGEILRPHVLRVPNVRFVNCHPSLLPAYRGTNPNAAAIRNGERQTGITFHLITERVDAGPILLQATVPITENDTGGDLRRRCAARAREMTAELVEHLENPEGLVTTNQDELGKPTFCRRLRNDGGFIQWHRMAKDIHNEIRALQPWVSSYTFVDSLFGPLKVVPKRSLTQMTTELHSTPGTVVAREAETVWVASGDASQWVGLRDVRLGLFSRCLPRWLSRALGLWLLRPGQVFRSSGAMESGNGRTRR